MLSYRGYGLSTGSASEVGIRIDAQTALDYLKRHPVLKDTIIIVYGQSLGGAVAIDVASRNAKTVSTRVLTMISIAFAKILTSTLGSGSDTGEYVRSSNID